MAPATEASTGARIRQLRQARGMSRPVLAGLVGRSPDWLKKIERGDRHLNSLPLLLRVADVLEVEDLSDLTGEDVAVPTSAWETKIHPVVPEIRRAMHDASFVATDLTELLAVGELRERTDAAWLLWHSSKQQRTEVGVLLPSLIRAAHRCVRESTGIERRRASAAAGDLYRLVQRLLAHICEPELHALAVERGRAMSEEADSPRSLALAAWSSAVSACASGDYSEAVRLADVGTDILRPYLERGPCAVAATHGALLLEAAAAHGLAGRAGDAYRYLDAAAETAGRIRPGYWHPQSAFDRSNVEILSVIIDVSLHRTNQALQRAKKIDLDRMHSVVRRSRLLLEMARAHAQKREHESAIRRLAASATTSTEAVALIPWARTLSRELATCAPSSLQHSASMLATHLHA